MRPQQQTFTITHGFIIVCALLVGISANSLQAREIGNLSADIDPASTFANRVEQIREVALSIERSASLSAKQAQPAFATDHAIPLYIRNISEDRILTHIRVDAGEHVLLNQPLSDQTRKTDTDFWQRVWLGGNIPVWAHDQTLNIYLSHRPSAQPESADLTTSQTQVAQIIYEGVTALEIIFEAGGLLSNSKLSLISWQADLSHQTPTGVLARLFTPDIDEGLARYRPATADDPELRHGLTLALYGRPGEAVNRLLSLGRGLQTTNNIPDTLPWALATANMQAGLLTRARLSIDELVKRQVDAHRLGGLQLRLAEFYYLRDDYTQAHRLLSQINIDAIPALQAQWQDLYARVLLHLNLDNNAAQSYVVPEGLFYEAHRNLSSPQEGRRLAAYTRYNRAIAYIRGGDILKGRTWLDIAGSSMVFDLETRSLRDKANSTLGWQLLRERQGTTAAKIFSRVRLDGPYTNEALLGSGWALFGMTGETVTRADRNDLNLDQSGQQLPDFVADALVQRKILDPQVYGPESLRREFGQAKKPKNEKEAAEKALPYWQTLIENELYSASVQEGLVAIGYAWQKLDEPDKAVLAYQNAIRKLEDVMSRIQLARKKITDDQWLASALAEINSASSEPGLKPGKKSRKKKTTPTRTPEQDAMLWTIKAARSHAGLLRIARYQSDTGLRDELATLKSIISAENINTQPGNAYALRPEVSESHIKNIQQWQSQIDKLSTELLNAQRREFQNLRSLLDQGLAAQEEQTRRYLRSALAGSLSLTLEPTRGSAGE